MRARIASLALGLVVAGCTTPQGPSGALSSQAGLPQVAATGDRLLVIREDGNLVTMLPDGTDVVALTRRAGQGLSVRQPTWSPDGHSIAWVELVSEGGGPEQAVFATAGPSGLDRREIQLDVGAFFLQWDPTGQRVAYLGSVQGTIGLGVVDGSQARLSITQVGAGQPFYLSWSPDGERLLVHVNGDQLGVAGLGGDVEDLGETPAVFQAPVWLDDGGMVYAVDDGPKTRLVVRDADRVRTLATVPHGVVFVVSDTGQVAYRPIDEEGRGGPVFVTDLRGSPPEVVTRRPIVAFYWSPGGDDLLSLSVQEGEQLAFRWSVWRDRERFRSEPFLPSPEFLEGYVPFFDQYAQAMSLWSPDGSSFVYAGLHEGLAGIWVQDLGGGTPSLVSDGSFAAWSSG